jgi:hypothetical protein
VLNEFLERKLKTREPVTVIKDLIRMVDLFQVSVIGTFDA